MKTLKVPVAKYYLEIEFVAPTEKHGESEGRFEISELHQNAGFFSSSLGEDQQLDTVSDGAVSSLPFPKRSHSACDIRTGT